MAVITERRKFGLNWTTKYVVTILVYNSWKNKIQSYRDINERLITTRMNIKRCYLTIVIVYEPENGYTEKHLQTIAVIQHCLQPINTTKNEAYIKYSLNLFPERTDKL